MTGRVTVSRELLRQVLVLFDKALDKDNVFGKLHNDAMDCLGGIRAALAEPAPVQEPVAWKGYDLDGMVEAFSRVIENNFQRQHPFHDPIDTDARLALRILRGFIPAMKRCTAHQAQHPAPPAEVPMLTIWVAFKGGLEP